MWKRLSLVGAILVLAALALSLPGCGSGSGGGGGGTPDTVWDDFNWDEEQWQ